MQKDLIILDEDKNWARRRIAELDAEIQALGPEFYDVFNQSSETWHDNAPFDALRDRQSVLDAERHQLKAILRNSLPSVPGQPKGKIGTGSEVLLSTGKKFFIAGDWTPHAGQLRGDAVVVSRNAPLAQELLGKKIGEGVRIGKRMSVIEGILG